MLHISFIVSILYIKELCLLWVSVVADSSDGEREAPFPPTIPALAWGHSLCFSILSIQGEVT